MLEELVSKVNTNFFIKCDQILDNRPRDHISHLYLSLFNISLKCMVVYYVLKSFIISYHLNFGNILEGFPC